MAPATLAAAVLGDGDAGFQFNGRTLLQQFYPTLTETQKTTFGPGPFRRNHLSPEIALPRTGRVRSQA